MHRVPGGGRRDARLGESVVRVALTLQLGVGVGMSAAVAAMLYGFVAHPLPFPSGRAIVQVHDTAVESRPIIVTDRQFDDGWGEMTGPFEHVAGHFMGAAPIVPALLVGETERLSVCAVAGDLFGVLGVHPRLGRSFSAQELRTGAAVVLIAESVWRQRFGSRADVLGVTIPSDRGPYAVIGVIEDRYVFPANAEAWAPRIAYTGPGRFMALQILARLKPEWTVDRATKVVATLAPPVRPGQSRPSVRLVRLADEVQETTRRPVTGAVLIAGLTLIAVGANLLHLWMARALAQRREYAIRLALGASVASLRRLTLVSTLRACAPGMALACVVACWLIRVLATVVPRNYYYAASLPTLAAVAIGFTAVVLLVLVVLLTLAHSGIAIRPAWNRDLRIAHVIDNGVLGTLRAGWALMAAQAALAVALVVMASAWTRSFTNVESADLGYQWQKLVTFRVVLPPARYADSEGRSLAYDSVLERLRTMVFADDVEATSKGLLSNPAGSSRPDQRNPETADQRWVTPGFLSSIGARLIEGRHLEPADRGRDVAMVNAAYQRIFLRGESAVGRIVAFNPPRTIVGVVDDIRDTDIPLRQPPVAYMPMTGVFPTSQFVIRLRSGATADHTAIRRAVAAVDPTIAVVGIRTMAERVEEARAPWRAKAAMVSLASVTSVIVLGVGVLAALWYAVARKRREIAVRLALGATTMDVATDLRRALRLPLAAGTALGLWGGWAMMTTSAWQLYGMGAGDAANYIVGASAVLVPGLLLPLLVARRTVRMNVRDALQAE